MSSVMADYFPVLSRAVAGLPTNTGESRRAVYERARKAIVTQLRSIDPPLSEEDISRERMQLEEAIRKVEADHGAPAAAPPPQPAPQAAPPPPQAAPPPPQPKAVEATKAAEPRIEPDRAPKQEPTSRRPEPSVQTGSAPAQPKRGPEVRADGRPIIRAAGEPGTERASKRSGPLVAVGALVLVGAAVVAFAARDQISSLFGGGSPPATQTASTDAAAPKPAEPPAGGGDKADDRLLNDPAPPANGQRPPETDVARAPDAAPPAAEPAPPAAPPAPAAPRTQAPAQPGPLVAQRAILYEEGSDQQSGEQVDGAIVWRTESVSGGQSQPLETALKGDIEIPGRNVRATLTIRRNIDATLPASHTIEIQFVLPENFSNAGVANVPGILMKADEAARGAPVSGLSVRVTSGFFLIGLSNIENERLVNEQLLRDRGWIDIPILYDNGRRAVLTLEKGTPGSQAFNDALAAWQSAAAGSAPAQP